MEYSTLDVAVLLEKGIVLNGIIANSPSITERRKAKEEFAALMPQFMELAKVSPNCQNVISLNFEKKTK